MRHRDERHYKLRVGAILLCRVMSYHFLPSKQRNEKINQHPNRSKHNEGTAMKKIKQPNKRNRTFCFAFPCVATPNGQTMTDNLSKQHIFSGRFCPALLCLQLMFLGRGRVQPLFWDACLCLSRQRSNPKKQIVDVACCSQILAASAA